MSAVAHASIWERHPGLVWSNRNADDSVRIRAALLKPSFHTLLDIAVAFGPQRLASEWMVLQADPYTETGRVASTVERILRNIQRGYEQARS